MNLNSNYKYYYSKIICRELRKNSTQAEKILWEIVRNRKFYGKRFYRQYPIFYRINNRESFFVADFFCFEEKLIIELDGKYHKYRLPEDNSRTEILNYLNFRVIRFNNEEIITNLDDVLIRIKNEFIK